MLTHGDHGRRSGRHTAHVSSDVGGKGGEHTLQGKMVMESVCVQRWGSHK